MNVNTRRVGVAALALVVCLSLSPVAVAAQPDQPFFQIREKIVRLLKKLKGLGDPSVLSDLPQPPRPTP